MINGNKPFISIVIAVYNAEKTLQQCLESISKQKNKNFELIVIDGASTDASIEIIKKNTNLIQFWQTEKDHGVYSAWNKALKHVRGEWIYFLGADDYLWNDDVVGDVVHRLKDVDDDVLIAYSKVMLVNEAGLSIYEVGNDWKICKDRFHSYMNIPHQGVFHRKSIFEKYGFFNEGLKISSDYEIMLKVLQHAPPLFIDQKIIAAMRVGGLSSTPKNAVKALLETRLAQINNGLKWPTVWWLAAMLRALVRLALWRVLDEKTARMVFDKIRKLMNKKAFWTS